MTAAPASDRPNRHFGAATKRNEDAKLLAVPIDKTCAMYRGVVGPEDMPQALLRQIAHFFEHYKDLEPEKWVRVGKWEGLDSARQEVLDSIERYQAAPEKPAF